MNWIKENGGVLVVGGVVLAIIAGYMEWRIGANVTSALADAGIVPEAKIVAMEDDIEDNKEDIGAIEDRWNRLVDALAAENGQ